MRHWHWLVRVVAISGLGSAAELDRKDAGRALTRTLTLDRPFRNIQIDGYNPRATRATSESTSLLDHINQFEGFEGAWIDYHHPFWQHLEDFLPGQFDQAAWLDQAAPRLGFLAVTSNDLSNALELGLDLTTHGDDQLGVLEALDREGRLASLDGMLLLLLLLRDLLTRDIEFHAKSWIRGALSSSARDFATSNGYSGETLTTWQCLIETRILRWIPDERPSPRFFLAADELLRDEQTRIYAAGGRDKRRAERRRFALALSLHVAQRAYMRADAPSTTDWNLYSFLPKNESNSAIVQWLCGHREEISRRVDHAVENLMLESDPMPLPDPALRMPLAVARHRYRPAPTEETTRHFGRLLPFDIINIDIVD